MLTKIVSIATLTITAVLLLGSAASAQIITEPTHLPVETGTTECLLTIQNGKSQHNNTTIIVQDVDTWENLAELYDVEADPFSTVAARIVPPASGHVTVQVIPNPGGISSLDPTDITCIPIQPAPVEVIEVDPIVETMTEPATPEPVDCEGVNADDTCNRSEPAPATQQPTPISAPVETPELSTNTEPATVASTPEALEPPATPPAADTPPELALTGVETWHIATLGTILLAAGIALTTFTRQTERNA